MLRLYFRLFSYHHGYSDIQMLNLHILWSGKGERSLQFLLSHHMSEVFMHLLNYHYHTGISLLLIVSCDFLYVLIEK